MKTLFLISICLLLTFSTFAQSLFKADTANLRKARKHASWDTLRYQKFNSNLIIGYFQSYRNFGNEFEQFKEKDTVGISKTNYFAESRLVSGIDITYDKFSLALGLRTTPPKQSEGKGNTKTITTNFNFGGNIWFLENSFRYFKGFYDKNTATYDTTFKKTGIYYQQPSLENTLFRSKFIYFPNHYNFAFRSGYAGSYRQIRSAATWVLSASVSYNNLRCDSSFFPMPSRAFYGDYKEMNGLKVIGASVNVGAAGALVIFKAFFVSGMLIIGPEQQWRTYSYTNEGKRPLSYVSWSGDGRGSFGLNLKRFYMVGTFISDFAIYNSGFVGILNTSISGSFSFGWRFRSKTPKAYKKFQQTRFYLAI